MMKDEMIDFYDDEWKDIWDCRVAFATKTYFLRTSFEASALELIWNNLNLPVVIFLQPFSMSISQIQNLFVPIQIDDYSHANESYFRDQLVR